jgi:tRNA 5-methylaminomethyl-2-thiouridine biosynthesis bifunctional protein
LSAEALRRSVPGELRSLASELTAQWPLPLAGLHRCEFDAGDVTLTLAFGDVRSVVPKLVLGADAIFLDGFAPDRNPAMWERAVLRAVACLARPDCRLATWTIASAVRSTLADSGFAIERAAGFGRKREMTVGRFAPRYVVRRHEPPTPYAGARDAIVVGAGLAGAACADALARRNWKVTLIDSAAPARGASALPWGLMHPHFGADDNRLARLTRGGSALTLRTLARIARDGAHGGSAVWCVSGAFQRAADAEESERWRMTLSRTRTPRGYVHWLDAAAAAERIGVQPAQAGLWWPSGTLASPERLTAALVAQPGIRLLQHTVDAVANGDNGWRICGCDGRVVARAPVVVVAAALDSPRLLQSHHQPVRAVGGQVTHVDAALQALRSALAGDGTLLRSPEGDLVVGATYEVADDRACAVLDERDAARSNLARLARLLAVPVEARALGGFAGVRCVARDRLPFAGAVADEPAALAAAERLRGAHFDDLPRRPGLYTSFALGSRGLTFAPLAAELIAARIEGEPLPLERELAGAVDPARVLLNRLRHGARLPRSERAC